MGADVNWVEREDNKAIKVQELNGLTRTAKTTGKLNTSKLTEARINII